MYFDREREHGGVCGKERMRSLMRCSRCMTACYCSAACQKVHWKDGHKEECAAIVARDAGLDDEENGSGNGSKGGKGGKGRGLDLGMEQER